MDTSPEYIEMCRKATEIQDLWNPSVADCCMMKDDVFKITQVGSDFLYPLSLYRLKDGNRMSWYSKADCTWLPRQDQLQHMVHEHHNLTAFHMLRSFTRWAENKYGNAYGYGIIWDSFEKYWLEYAMYLIYRKVWNGSDWVEVD